MKPIHVYAVYYKDRRKWMLYYRDPVTKRRISRTTELVGRGKTGEKAAERLAAAWQDELRLSRSNVTWEHFRQRYEEERLSSLAKATYCKACSVFNSLEKIVNPRFLSDLTPEAISRYQTQLREKGIRGKALSLNTVANHLAHIKAALNWAVEVELLSSAPKIKRPQRASKSRKMKGRPITGEEFERMLKQVPKIVGKEAAASWKHYLKGLWWSGLRLSESLELYWDRDDRLKPILAGENSCLSIPASLEKGNKDRICPMAPEFVEFLEQTSQSERRGPVFRPLGEQGIRVGSYFAGHVISDIGKDAGIVVDLHSDTGKPKKFASAHDLRRSFGERWSKRIMPPQLQELMRHESIETTLRFYVGQNAQQTAKSLWSAYRKTESAVQQNVQHDPKKTTPKKRRKPHTP